MNLIIYTFYHEVRVIGDFSTFKIKSSFTFPLHLKKIFMFAFLSASKNKAFVVLCRIQQNESAFKNLHGITVMIWSIIPSCLLRISRRNLLRTNGQVVSCCTINKSIKNISGFLISWPVLLFFNQNSAQKGYNCGRANRFFMAGLLNWLKLNSI